MKEVKSPKKPLLYYYGIVLLIIALFNLLVTPLLNRRSIEEVDYGTFMSKIEAQQIKRSRSTTMRSITRKRAARPSTARASWTTRA